MRLVLAAGIAAVHLLLIFFLAFNMKVNSQPPPEFASVMKLTDFTEYVPVPVRPPSEFENQDSVESIAENMIETDTPVDNVLAAGVFLSTENFLPMHMVSHPPQFDSSAIINDLVYPPIALRSGIEGSVIVELFVDRAGLVQRVDILKETPEGRGFGEAAVKVFMGRKGIPAVANGQAVSIRYRYPVRFSIK